MIKASDNPEPARNYDKELRVLQKQFKEQGKQDVRLVFEFCEYDVRTAYKALASAPAEKQGQLVKLLIARPDKSDEILTAAISRFNHSHLAEQPIPAAIQALLEPEKPAAKQLIMPFFEKLPKLLLFEILQFLRPVEIASFVRLQPSLQAAYLSATTRKEDYYRGVCQVLFPSAIPNLPVPTVFLPLKQHILEHPLQFGPNLRHAAQHDFQNLVWHCYPEQFKLDKQHYMDTYGSYEGIYHGAPRVHFNGYYVLREKYMRRGDYSLDTPGVPIYLVEYYKYVRFFPNGSLLYRLSNRKLKDEELASALSIDRMKDDDNVIRGEFMQYKQLLYLRLARSTSMFFYECEIGTEWAYSDTRKVMFDALTVMRFGLQLLDNSMMVQQLYIRKTGIEDRVFVYRPLAELAKQNTPQIQAVSL